MAEFNWIRIEDHLPNDWQQVIAWAPDGKSQTKKLMQQCAHTGVGRFSYGFYNNELMGVTHWAEMPEPPEDDE